MPLVAGQARDALRPLIALPGLSFAVDHLYRLVERLHGEPAHGRAQVQPLPDASGRERRLAIIAVADGDNASQRRGSELDVASSVEPGRVAGLGRNRKEPRIGEREEREARGIKSGTVAMGFDLGARRAKPAVAIGNHCLVIDDGLGRFNDRRIERAPIFAFVEQDYACILLVTSPAQEFPPVRGYRLAPLVSVAIGVPQ